LNNEFDLESVRNGVVDASGSDVAVAVSNYVGSNHSATETQTNHVVLQSEGLQPNGIFFDDSSVGFGSITDGASNTILIGERTWTFSNPLPGGDDFRAGASNPFGFAIARTTGLVQPRLTGRVVMSTGSGGINSTFFAHAARGFSSSHPGGLNFAYCDGSVRYTSDEVPTGQIFSAVVEDIAFQNLMARNDGHVNVEF